jgi:hypothetical protein
LPQAHRYKEFINETTKENSNTMIENGCKPDGQIHLSVIIGCEYYRQLQLNLGLELILPTGRFRQTGSSAAPQLPKYQHIITDAIWMFFNSTTNKSFRLILSLNAEIRPVEELS